MRILSWLETPVRQDNPLGRMPAEPKLVLWLLLVIAAAASPLRAWPEAGWLVIGGVTFIWIAGWLASRIPARIILLRLLFLEPFVLGVAILSWFQEDGGAVVASILVKSTLCLALAVLLTLTTPFPAISRALRRLGAPSLLVTTIILLYRYLFVLLEELGRMRLARASRTFRPSKRRTWWLTAAMIGELFVRSSERAERIHAAMCSRGWN